MKTIGIIGASGQVGTEVCLFLKTYPDVRVVAIVRSPVSGALLRRLGVECRVGVMADEAQCRTLLAECDLVADFSLRLGEVADTVGHYRNNITKTMRYAPRGARYVFISTINAFGFSQRFNKARHYIVPNSLYAVTKRFGERLTTRLGRTSGRDAYVFRLGHVYGVLQRVSLETQHLVNSGYRSFEYPDTPSYTIFCHSIAEALVNVAAGREKPGMYVLISEPTWSWKEVLEYYAGGRPLNVRLIDAVAMRARRSPLRKLQNRVIGALVQYRDTLRATVLHRFPDLEKKQKAALLVRRARQQISELEDRFVYRPEGIHEGVFPGDRLTLLSDSRTSMAARTDAVKTMLHTLDHSE